MYFSKASTLTAVGCLSSLGLSVSLPVQERQIVYCGDGNTPAFATTGDAEGGPGFYITNNDVDANVKYFIIENSRDTHPWKYLDIPIGTRAFVSVCSTFQGRIQRGNPSVQLDGNAHTLGTWVEASVDSTGAMYGDISFLEGCDGGAALGTTDGTNLVRGCTAANLLTGAPAAALITNDYGNAILDVTIDKPNRAYNAAARAWELSVCDAAQVWIDDPNYNAGAIIRSGTGTFEVVFTNGVV
ncbi:hypothetical protein JX265_010968 [Neoarthrinium moseri]|uniref:Uncharacterized protein n=1 Tax=Neoarthrinium moseri TaxID=1658444 RepID=A0A9P9WDA9_9PEZI|nr:uncharacterized protein JN550_009667 [Neoarthrinium moseri]KAI1851734.1 hypothetical protein JX266_003196 [Neoarthrinium moseri]KAI1857938.1 hypothetical protein JX265_010968 [Neoarthrinium moseri]KAI1863347.1 hypothetical protein JN550_009667 [Neoarthrinium moseri]